MKFIFGRTKTAPPGSTSLNQRKTVSRMLPETDFDRDASQVAEIG